MTTTTFYALFLLAYSMGMARSFDTEVLSDITDIVMPSHADQGRALDVKKQDFWVPVQQAASNGADVAHHESLYQEVERIATDLPSQNDYVRKALLEAVAFLRHADAAVLTQSRDQGQLANERLSQVGSSSWGWVKGGLSFLSGGQWGGFLSLSVARFVDGGNYQPRLRAHIEERRTDSVQLLRGVADSTGSVLGDCRRASQRSFDLLKYDIYQQGVPKTPEAAKEAANWIVDASAETRSRFMGLMMGTVKGLTRDAEGETDKPSATVARALAEDAEPLIVTAHAGLSIGQSVLGTLL